MTQQEFEEVWTEFEKCIKDARVFVVPENGGIPSAAISQCMLDTTKKIAWRVLGGGKVEGVRSFLQGKAQEIIAFARKPSKRKNQCQSHQNN